MAKWTQSTIYLNSGHTHSCHHPSVHKIPLQNLEDNPSQIHNTPEKLSKRKEMLDGIRPSECNYCWQIEDLGKNLISDRILKSSMSWSLPFYEKILASQTGSDYIPSYLEVLFDTACNFKCVYCSPNISSKIKAEIDSYGPYKLGTETIGKIEEERQGKDETRYVEAFWKILPKWWENLQTLRVTGGEPLLSNETWKLFDYVKNHEHPNLILGINSNLGVPDAKINLLIKYINEMSGKLHLFEVYTSNEASGPAAEFIRHGLNYNLFINNVKKILTETDAKLTLMTTVNALSYSTFSDCVFDFLKLRKEFPDRIRSISFNFLRYPVCLDLRYLPLRLKSHFILEMEKILETNELVIFEKESAQRLVEFVQQEPKNKKNVQKDLLDYLVQIDKRRSTDSRNIFSDLFTEVEAEIAQSKSWFGK